MTDLKTALWCDLTTDAERSAWLLLGRGYETGVVAKAIQNDLARAYQRLGAIMSGDHNQYQKPDREFLQQALERISKTSYIRDAHSIAIEALRIPENKREWVGLPNDEVLERANKFRDPETYLRGVLWAEAKLKEKNS